MPPFKFTATQNKHIKGIVCKFSDTKNLEIRGRPTVRLRHTDLLLSCVIRTS